MRCRGCLSKVMFLPRLLQPDAAEVGGSPLGLDLVGRPVIQRWSVRRVGVNH